MSPFTGPLAQAWPAVRPGLLRPPGRCLPVPPATDRATWAAPDAATLAALRSRAAGDLRSPWPVPLASGYARFFRDGDRDGYEQVVWARHERVGRAAVLAAVTLDERWLDEVADGVTLWCEQSSWCWPAHDDTFERHGAVVPTVTDPCLDLGAGEVAADLAWIDHLLGAPLDERAAGVRARIRWEVERRVLLPFERRRDWQWLGIDGDVHNWNPWIHGNVLVAALQLVEAGERRDELVRLVIEGIDRFVAALPPDGAIDEGYAYWWNGAGRLLEALDVLAYASAGVLSATPVPVLRETVAFPHRMHLGGPWYVNFADCPARPTGDQPWQALHRDARRAGDPAALAHAAARRRPGTPVAHESDGLGRLLRALTDPEWLAASPAEAAPSPAAPLPAAPSPTTGSSTAPSPAAPSSTGSPPAVASSAATAPAAGESWLPREVWLPSTQVLVARMAAGSSAGLTLAVKGGHNDENHNHNDVGSFVVALNGVPVLVDPGRPTYTGQTFGPRRYELWMMRSSWHNVPEIRGSEQAPGRECRARDVGTGAGPAYAKLVLDLADAYPEAGVRTWRRTARLDRAEGTVTVTDQWELAPGADLPTRIHLVLAGAVSLGDGHAEVRALDGAGVLRLSWNPPVPCGISVRELDDPLLSDVWGDRLTRLEIDVSGLGPIGTLDLTVKEPR
ncbi:heparinase II/III family protein [Actinoplanes oblitus]|uniref:Heparinase II/III family protein n=1 Tax=Actinoplanes oblitus TaxID=3040509 RepID=A0ABY8WNS4_9ACTN|nr:heparinase II/III family protein [Actinoplanes oblitus]WIM98525.1 heparinase II/III family protein [Actinoplanes oblitus]